MTTRLAHRLRMLALRVATENARDYLLSLNLKALQKTVKKGPQDDPRTFYEGLRAQAEKGPLFKREVLDTIGNLHITLEKQEVQWLATQLQATGNEFMKHGDIDGRLVQHLPSLLDYFKAERPDLSKLTIPEAFEKSHAWHQQFKGKEDSAGAYKTNKVVKRWDDGFTMVELSPEDCQVEGDLMGHCVGDYAEDVAEGKTEIYSLRDPKNRPHVTIEVQPKWVWGKTHKELRYTVEQIQGKENKEPVEKYHKYIDEWLHERGLHDENTLAYASPARLAQMTSNVLERIVNGTSSREYPLRKALGTLDTLLENPRLPESALNEIVECKGLYPDDPAPIVTAADHPNATETTKLRALHTWMDPDERSEHFAHVGEEVALQLAGSPRSTEKVFRRILSHTEVTHRMLREILSNPAASDDVKREARKRVDELDESTNSEDD